MQAVTTDSLSIVAEVGAVGQGTVYAVTVAAADGPRRRLAYKRHHHGPVDQRALAAQVDLIGRLPPGDRRLVLARAAWPRAAVTHPAHGPAGFVMAPTLERFLPTPPATGCPRDGPAVTGQLLGGAAPAPGRGPQCSRTDQYLLASSLAELLTVLHRHGVTIGDTPPEDIRFRLRPRPEVFVIDTDAMVLGGRSICRPTPLTAWTVPARPDGTAETVESESADLYRFALLVLRLLTNSRDSRDPADLPPDVSAEISAFVQRGLSAHPAARPRSRDWIEQLQRAAHDADDGVPGMDPPGAAPPAQAPIVAPAQPTPLCDAAMGAGAATRFPAPAVIVFVGLFVVAMVVALLGLLG